MPASLIRSRAMITRALDRHRWEEVADGAVLQEDGTITAIGSFADLSRQHPTVPVIGTGNEILLPGFINGHHHVGLTPVQLGSPDMPLELWFVTRMVMRNVNMYLDTLYSAFEMITSGITTVQHLHGWAPGKLADVETRCEDVIRAYQDVGMRVSYSFSVRDQNRLVYQADQDFVASLPAELRGPVQRWYDRFQLSLDDHFALFETLHRRHHTKSRVKIQLSPANLHWCSDAALTRFAEVSRQFNAPLHMHLVETAYQKEYAHRRGGGTAVDYIDRFGLLGPQMTLGHGDRHLHLPQLLVELPPALWRGGAERVRGEGDQYRDRPRRGGHQRRSRHAAGDAHGAARAPGAGHGRRCTDAGAGVPHGDVGWCQDHGVR
jgi:cytosine/adenosine deaminase-related metal-dependent hydrolase